MNAESRPYRDVPVPPLPKGSWRPHVERALAAFNALALLVSSIEGVA
jgi:hypothetical protein